MNCRMLGLGSHYIMIGNRKDSKIYVFDRNYIIKVVSSKHFGNQKHFIRDINNHRWEKASNEFCCFFKENFESLAEEIEYAEENEQIIRFNSVRWLTKDEISECSLSKPIEDYYKDYGLFYADKSAELEIDYKEEYSKSYTLKSFSFRNQQDFMPPQNEFYDLMNSQEKNTAVLIWYSCAFIKYGITFRPLNRHCGKAGLLFSYDGVSIRLFESESINGFEFFVADSDKCETIAEALRDIIIREGRSITYNDWSSKNWRWYSSYCNTF